jgi:hypothetical protein
MLTGCPVYVPSPGGVEGRWSQGKNEAVESNRSTSQEIFYNFSGPTATLEWVHIATAGGRRAELVISVTSAFDVEESESGPALAFSQGVPARSPAEAELRNLASVYVAGLTPQERADMESGLLEGQTLEDAYVNSLEFSTILITGTLSGMLNCFGTSCSPVPFSLEGDTLVLSLSSGDVTLARV